MENLIGQYAPPVKELLSLEPERIFTSPAGELILDVGQVVAGNVEFTVTAPSGTVITLEHSEVLDENGNYYNNILGVNKEQQITYITKEGTQTYRPYFTYHGFRYVRISGWTGRPSVHAFKIHVFSSKMENIGDFYTSDARINRLRKNIWWSQVANTISIPTDCPQREKAGWTGDIMAYAPTMCFNRGADAFLTSCGWGDAVLMVPLAVYEAYGDRRILEENYGAMKKWLAYIQDRCENHHPEGYVSWDTRRRERSRYLWNTDFHFGDWLIPSIVLGNPDGAAMNDTAFATMHIVAQAYGALSAKTMAKIAGILGNVRDQSFYETQYEQRRQAFIEEYVHDDGTIDGDFQGIYVIALKVGLVPEHVRPKMAEHLCQMIRDNRGCLDTGFLSVLFLMDVLTENGKRDAAYKLLFQTRCPSWLYEVEKGATTLWESWGAIGEDGSVSTYSYNHYAFGCVGAWMYREIGGLKALEPGYRKMLIRPSLDCGLDYACVSEETPYGKAQVFWEKLGNQAVVQVIVPANTTALICLHKRPQETVGSGRYVYVCDL